MSTFRPKPHVSAALAHLQAGVTGAACVLALCAAVQLLVFGFVHFTEVRFAEPVRQASPITVVGPVRPIAPPAGVAGTTGIELPPAGFTPGVAPRTLTDWDISLNTATDVALSTGILAGLMLAMFCALGVVIAAGSGVPGVQRAVSATTWAILLGLACLPWRDLIPTMLFRGVFGDYRTLVSMSTAVNAGTESIFPMLTAFLLTPFACLCGAMMVLWRFRQGIAEGVIITSVSELDERLEREIAGIRAGGVNGAPAARAVGALNSAIGDRPERPALPDSPPNNGPASPSIRKTRSVPLSKVGRSWVAEDEGGEDFKRPI